MLAALVLDADPRVVVTEVDGRHQLTRAVQDDELRNGSRQAGAHDAHSNDRFRSGRCPWVHQRRREARGTDPAPASRGALAGDELRARHRATSQCRVSNRNDLIQLQLCGQVEDGPGRCGDSKAVQLDDVVARKSGAMCGDPQAGRQHLTRRHGQDDVLSVAAEHGEAEQGHRSPRPSANRKPICGQRRQPAAGLAEIRTYHRERHHKRWQIRISARLTRRVEPGHASPPDVSCRGGGTCARTGRRTPGSAPPSTPRTGARATRCSVRRTGPRARTARCHRAPAIGRR